MSVVNYRGKRDEFRIFISVTEDGRRRRITEIVHGSKRDALARETQIKAELALETHVEASRQTVRQFESDWWSTKAASLSPTTAHRYRGLLDLHILAALGEIRIQKVRASHIAAIVRRLVEDEKHRTAKNVGSAKSGCNGPCSKASSAGDDYPDAGGSGTDSGLSHQSRVLGDDAHHDPLNDSDPTLRVGRIAMGGSRSQTPNVDNPEERPLSPRGANGRSASEDSPRSPNSGPRW